MYKIIKAMSKDGTDKLSGIESRHSLYGELYVGNCVLFTYNDDSEQMMRTSTIEKVEILNTLVKVITMNTEYWFEKVGE